VLHALSFDVEEYFQVANLRGAFARADWESVPSRLEHGMSAILRALEAQRAHATFFWLGWVAERHPAWVRRCLEAGHEIASHGYEHAFLQDLGRAGLVRDLELTEQALAAAGAPRPLGFRASTFTLTRATWWAFEVLAERGYRYDSSASATGAASGPPIQARSGMSKPRFSPSSTSARRRPRSASRSACLPRPPRTFSRAGRFTKRSTKRWSSSGGRTSSDTPIDARSLLTRI